MSELRVVSVEIRDVLGAREFALEPGRVTVLSGRNGSGKSTALTAVQAAIGGGSLAKLARVDPGGAETEPEVVLVLRGAGQETYRVERTGEKVRVRSRVGETAGFEDVPKPQAWLSGLYDGGGANPVRFLTAPDKERAIMLLEALPLRFDRGELLAEMGVTPDELPPIPAGLHPLEEVGLIRDAVFRARTGVNRDAHGKAAAAEQTRRNAPAAVPDDPGGAAMATAEAAAMLLGQEIATAEAKAEAAERAAIADAKARVQVAEQRVAGSFKAQAAKLRTAHEAQAAEVRAAAERRVAELLAETETAIDSLRSKGEDELEADQAQADALVTAAHDAREASRVTTRAMRADLAQQQVRLAELRAQREAAASARALHEQARKFDAEAEALARESARLTAAIDALDAHRRRMAEHLPIPGLSIEGKEIKVHGVPFEQLNTAAKVGIAVQVSTLRAKGQRLPVVWVDGAEALDSEHFEALVAALQAAGVQAFVARVTDTDLQVEAVA